MVLSLSLQCYLARRTVDEYGRPRLVTGKGTSTPWILTGFQGDGDLKLRLESVNGRDTFAALVNSLPVLCS